MKRCLLVAGTFLVALCPLGAQQSAEAAKALLAPMPKIPAAAPRDSVPMGSAEEFAE